MAKELNEKQLEVIKVTFDELFGAIAACLIRFHGISTGIKINARRYPKFHMGVCITPSGEVTNEELEEVAFEIEANLEEDFIIGLMEDSITIDYIGKGKEHP